MQRDIADGIRMTYEAHPGYRHWFWSWFASAEHDLKSLQAFALMYYEHVLRFRLYVAAALTVAPSEQLQVTLARVLADEYGIPLATQAPVDSHPEMFRRFMRSLGLSEEDWSDGTPIPGIQHFFELHFALFRGALVSESIGAVLFGMESTTPYRHQMVIDGVRGYESRSGQTVDLSFFTTHLAIDEHHSSTLLDTAWSIVEEDPSGVARGARYSFDAREVFLDDLAFRLGASRDEVAPDIGGSASRKSSH